MFMNMRSSYCTTLVAAALAAARCEQRDGGERGEHQGEEAGEAVHFTVNCPNIVGSWGGQ